MADKNDLKKTLNLPQTSFAMKAQLVQKNLRSKKMEKIDLYHKIIATGRASRPSFFMMDHLMPTGIFI
jgi:isoleucyl-tRNA synthetase